MNNYDNNDREGTVSSLAQDKMQALELWKVSAEIVQLENWEHIICVHCDGQFWNDV